MSNEQPPLERETARAVLAHLGVTPGPPDLRLLRTLGYRGYLTLNDMTAFARTGCHSAIVVTLDPSLADATRGGYVYTLIDTPVADAAYRRALTDDYAPDGLFLDKGQ